MGTYVAFGQQVGTELQVIIQVERPAGLELLSEGLEGNGIGQRQFLHAAHTSELLVGVLGGGETRSPA
jgi:hypothetical protein